MDHDWLWIKIIGFASFTIMVCYFVIAYYWFLNIRFCKDALTKKLLSSLLGIFVFCGIAGYGFNIIRIWFPVYRLQVIFLLLIILACLAFITRIATVKIDFTNVRVQGTDSSSESDSHEDFHE